MRIVYAALDQRVPGTTGGSVHVTAVAEGLAALGHEVHVLTTPGPGSFPAGLARWHALAPPLGLRHLRVLRTYAVRAFAEGAGAEVIIERYHNFGGEGMRAATMIGALAVLEVNAPVVDYPGSPKARLDKALLIEPMRRWRDRQCRMADLLVTPTAEILPAFVPRDRVVEIEWGADTDRFEPGAKGPTPFTRRPATVVAVFAGAFRAWHGAVNLVRAIRELRSAGRHDIDAVLIGDGPELARVRAEAAGIDGITLTGALEHDRMPACLAAADIGVAPFDVPAHPPLQRAFSWAPRKIFEYMAAGLPVVAPNIPRLASILGSGQQGQLYDPDAPGALANALARLAGDDVERRRLGAAARARVCLAFSWAAHCRTLDGAIRQAMGRRAT